MFVGLEKMTKYTDCIEVSSGQIEKNEREIEIYF